MLSIDPIHFPHKARLQHSHQHAKNATTMYLEEIELDKINFDASVYSNKKEIPTNIAPELRYAALSPDLRIHFKDKYNWSETTVDKIDWEIHSKALDQQHPTMRKTTTQFIHRWLPTHGHRGTKNDITTKCPICHKVDETNDHFLTCDKNPEIQLEWKQQLQIFYDEMDELFMDPILLYYMILALDQWKTIRNPPEPEFSNDQYKQLFQEQNAIGWNQVIYGRLTKSWVDIQNAYSVCNPNGIMVISKAINKIYKLVYHIWNERCNYKYRKIDSDTYRNNILNPKIHQLYATKSTLNIIDSNYFDRPVNSVLNNTIPYIQSWIKTTKIYVQQATMLRTQQQMRSIPQIHTLFARRSTTRQPKTRRPIIGPTKRSVTSQQSQTRILTNPVPQIDRTRDRPPPDPDPRNIQYFR